MCNESIDQRLPSPDYKEWAIGQHLMAVEAQILRRALTHILDQNAIALPLHDALLVPNSAVGVAEEAIRKAWSERLGGEVRLKVSQGES